MGHQRLGDIPKTQKWDQVVAKIAGSRSSSSGAGSGSGAPLTAVSDIAKEILLSAEGGLAEVKQDPSFSYTVFLLTQIVLAARQDDWQQRLQELGIVLSPEATVFELTGQLHEVIDKYRRKHRGSVTIGEMAQQAAGEAITSLAKDNAITLFGSGRDELQQAIRKLSTRAGFSDLGQHFFGSFTARFLDFYASKIVPKQAGQPGFQSASEFNEFRRSLFQHCHQSAKIVHDFCGQWYSKTEWEKGIDLHNSAGLVTHAIDKMRDELGKQREAIQ